MTACKYTLALLPLALWLAAAQPQSPGYASYEKANALFVAKKLPEAWAATDEALKLDPKLVPALTLKAKIAMGVQRLDVARRCLEQALAIDPKSAYAQFLYGLEAYMGNDVKEALPRFRKARQLSPNDPRAALYLGLTVESLGQPAEAMSLYEEAVRLERAAGGAQADIMLPGIRLLMILGRLDDCERWLAQALKANPKSRDAHFELARLQLKKGDAARAADEGETALTLSDGATEDKAIHYLLVRAYRQNGMADRAEMHAEVMRALEAPKR
jgi:tetratricopeptide (TPR) repeat protein